MVVIRPAAHTEAQVASALAAAMQDGRLASKLQALGVQLAVGVQVTDGGSSPQPDVVSAAPSNNKATVGAAVGAAVGGAVVVCASAVVYQLMRSRAKAATGRCHKSDLPVSTLSANRELPAKLKVGPALAGGQEVHSVSRSSPACMPFTF